MEISVLLTVPASPTSLGDLAGDDSAAETEEDQRWLT
jgi:hypothetical protein